MQKLIELESMSSVKIRKVTVNNGVIFASFWSFKHPNIEVFAKRIGNHLAVINSELETSNLAKYEMKDVYFYLYFLFRSFINSSFIYAVIFSIPVLIVNFPCLLNPNELMADAAILTVMLVSFLAIICIGKFRKTPYMHLVVLKIFTMGSLGVFGVFLIEMHQLNIKGDNQEFHTFVSKVVNKTVFSSTRGGTSYYIQLEDWQDDIAVEDISISEKQYKSVWKGMDMKITQGTGHLGYPWVKSITSLGFPEKH